ncbi:MAG: type II toxin-antitoxin system VapC family toxin [Patescibacteria group bacterium]
MTVRYLIDTDWAIDHMNAIDRVVRRLQELRPQGLALSIVSLAELYEGVHYSRDPERSQQALDAFLADVAVLGIDEEICKIFGRERGKLRRQGQLFGDLDLLIAATCLHYGLTLLTNNCQHFNRVEGLQMESIREAPPSGQTQP